jgi:hypothetical protein
MHVIGMKNNDNQIAAREPSNGPREDHLTCDASPLLRDVTARSDTASRRHNQCCCRH